MLKDNGKIVLRLDCNFLLLQKVIALYCYTCSSWHDTFMLLLNRQTALSVFQIGALY